MNTVLKRLLIIIGVFVAILLTATILGSFYMVEYALGPNPERQDTAKRFAWLYENYPETRSWMDSLRQHDAIRDTFVVMPSGERHHAYVVLQPGLASGDSIAQQDCQRMAIVVHGWRDQGIGMLMIARIYERLGWNVVVPDLHAHGLSEGEAIGMGWQERRDVLHWMELFRTDTMVVHGISMGAATTMNVSGEVMPQGIKSIRFVEDCGYTSVWDEFEYELSEDFGLPAFPLLYTTSLLCRLKYGWSFTEAAPLRQVARCPYPVLFIHGDDDHFVPSWMVHPLYEAKDSQKELWITRGVQHALSYKTYPEEYTEKVREFVK